MSCFLSFIFTHRCSFIHDYTHPSSRSLTIFRRRIDPPPSLSDQAVVSTTINRRTDSSPDKEKLETCTRMKSAIITYKCCFMLSLIIMLQAICRAHTNVLNVGEELQKETLSLESGSRIYQLEG